MAKITMTLSGVTHYNDHSRESKTTADISISTEKETYVINIPVKDNNNEEKILEHKLSILDLCFHKKMYQPTEIIVDINIIPAEGKSTEYRTLLSPTTSRSYLSL